MNTERFAFRSLRSAILPATTRELEAGLAYDRADATTNIQSALSAAMIRAELKRRAELNALEAA